MTRALRIAVDIGGTFTDLAAFDEQGRALHLGKALSTHAALVRGIQHAVEDAGVAIHEAQLFLHGSTIAINTLLERTGARTALLVTQGFRDIYEIGRINRPDAYNLFFDKHRPLVPRSLRLEVPERLLADGSTHRALDEAAVRALADTLREQQVEAVAILLLHSYRNATHEKRVQAIVQQLMPDAFVTASHSLTQEYREFERASTVAANAYIGPRVQGYLGELDDHLKAQGFDGDFYAVQSTGGLFPVADARHACVRMLESGPAAGVVGATAVCAQLGLGQAIAFDMGGTTAKAGVIVEGRPLTTGSALIGAYERALPIQIPMIDIFEVGTGGGSIAHLVEGNALRVGPRSAGSLPGPAAYAQGGTEPTVTDANLLLGRLDADHFLGGQMKLDITAAREAMLSRIAAPLGLASVEEAADGIVRIAATAMSYAVKGVTTERGMDAGDFPMIVYGGAGPLHASAVAREIGIRRVIVPYAPGHFSAWGMLYGDLRHDFVCSCFERLNDVPFDQIESLYAEMQMQGTAAIGASAVVPEQLIVTRAADMRYVGQEHAVTVEIPQALFDERDRKGIKGLFDEVHLQRYGTSAPDEAADLVSVRLTVQGTMRKPPQRAWPVGDGVAVPVRHKSVYFRETGLITAPVYDRSTLQAGHRIDGPALVEEHASTTVLWPGDALTVNGFGHLDIMIGLQA